MIEDKGFAAWFNSRMPSAKAMWEVHMSKYYAPKNFNFWYYFGVLSLVVLVIQLVTGIWLLMSYQGSAEEAFASVEYIMRDVELGWIIRYAHSTGASMFFIVVYAHMFRGLMYGSYKAPRELVWIFGCTIYVALMAEAFMGYVLPWGQMSYWGAQVIISLFGAIPVIGEDIVQWIRGDYLISGITLNRFMSLHVVAVPIILIALAIAIIVYLLHWLYRRSSKEVSFVRTGMFGEKVIISGGAFVLPIIHNITQVGMRTLCIIVKRGGDKALITSDRMRAEILAEF